VDGASPRARAPPTPPLPLPASAKAELGAAAQTEPAAPAPPGVAEATSLACALSRRREGVGGRRRGGAAGRGRGRAADWRQGGGRRAEGSRCGHVRRGRRTNFARATSRPTLPARPSSLLTYTRARARAHTHTHTPPHTHTHARARAHMRTPSFSFVSLGEAAFREQAPPLALCVRAAHRRVRLATCELGAQRQRCGRRCPPAHTQRGRGAGPRGQGAAPLGASVAQPAGAGPGCALRRLPVGRFGIRRAIRGIIRCGTTRRRWLVSCPGTSWVPPPRPLPLVRSLAPTLALLSAWASP
jgi:hypothetical protein